MSLDYREMLASYISSTNYLLNPYMHVHSDNVPEGTLQENGAHGGETSIPRDLSLVPDSGFVTNYLRDTPNSDINHMPSFDRPPANVNYCFSRHVNIATSTAETRQSNFWSDLHIGFNITGDLYNHDMPTENYSGRSNDRITASLYSDLVITNTGKDTVYAGDGNDIILAGSHDDTVFGDEGNDFIHGDLNVVRELTDQYHWNEFIDIINGTWSETQWQMIFMESLGKLAGNDWLEGGDGNDTIYGGAGNDVLKGDAGDDSLNGGDGADYLNGGEGIDVASYVNSTSAVQINLLYGIDTNNVIHGNGVGGEAQGDDLVSIECIIGSSFDDTILGDGNANALDGRAGNDQIAGGLGNDIINGGEGNDQITGGLGNDIINGNEGNDTMAGNAGVDFLTGGTGDDYYLFGLGSENDFVLETANGGTDVAYLVGMTDLYVLRQGNDLLLAPNDNDIMIFQEWFAHKGVDLVYFEAIGKAYTAEYVASLAVTMNSSDTSPLGLSALTSNATAEYKTIDFSQLGENSVEICGIDELINVPSLEIAN